MEQFKNNHKEGIHFDIGDQCATLVVYLNNPTLDETEQFYAGMKLGIRFVEMQGVIMLAAKIGNFKWMDAPYTAHLSKNLTEHKVFEDGQGLGLVLMLVDAVTGELKHQRLIGLPTKFSRKLYSAIEAQKEKNFDKAEYAKAVARIYSAYSASQIAKLGNAYL